MKEILCSNGKAVIVDDEDFDLLSTFKWRGNEYPQTSVRRRTLSMHTFVCRGAPGTVVDHINGDRYDNRRSNLRSILRRQNSLNIRKRKVGPFNPYKGVIATDSLRYPRSRQNKSRGGDWYAKIGVNGKLISLGRFHTKEEAARAYDAAALRYFGEFASLNFPKGNEAA